MQLSKIDTQTRLNKNRVTKTYNIGDFVFCKDRSIVIGTNPSLRTVYSDDPHIILQERPTTLVTQRLSDSFTSVYSKDDVKLYNRLDASFSHLPQEVKEVLINKFEDLDKLHFDTLQKYAKLPLPQSTILNQLDPISESENSEDDQDSENNSPTAPIISSQPTTPNPLITLKLPDTSPPPLPQSVTTIPPTSDLTNTNNILTQSTTTPKITQKKHRYATRQSTKLNKKEENDISSDDDEEDTSLSKQVTFD